MNKLALLLMTGLPCLSCSAFASEYRAFLVVYPNGKYVLPSGETVVVEGSKTSGLQEAIDRAVKDGFDLYVAGGDYKLNFNRLDCSFVHEQFNTSVAEGFADRSSLNHSIRGNQWNVHCAPGANACAVDAQGNHGRWIINAVAEKGPLRCGLTTHTTTTDNTFVLQNLDGKVSGPFSKKEPGSNRFE